MRHLKYVTDLKGKPQHPILKEDKTDALLTAEFKYKFNPLFSTLKGTLHLVLYPASSEIKSLIKREENCDKPMLKFNVSVAIPLPHHVGNLEKNAKCWSQDKASFLKKALEDIVEQLCFKVAQILKHPERVPHEA